MPQHTWSSILPILFLLTSPATASSPYRVWPRQETTEASSGSTEIRIRNNCGETIWPGIGTQAGKGPETNGFELSSGSVRSLSVSDDWQGRVWGRTNCSFNEDGTRSSSGSASACGTGDCFGVLNCVTTGATPVTLFEIALKAGTNSDQSFYDISLVDGYNLPMGVQYIGGGTGKDLPPNLTNCACVASTNQPAAPADSGNASFPMPSADVSASDLGRWCPWDHQVDPPTKPGDGVYPYPDDDIKRPDFSPCLSGCAKTNSDEACCTGKYNDPNVCKPGMFSQQAKAVCPDAYSFAFDDQSSTFIVPSGGGWEVAFCPGVASTNIIKTFPKELADLGQGRFGEEEARRLRERGLEMQGRSAVGKGKGKGVGVKSAAGPKLVKVERERVGSLGGLVVMLAFVCLW